MQWGPAQPGLLSFVNYVHSLHPGPTAPHRDRGPSLARTHKYSAWTAKIQTALFTMATQLAQRTGCTSTGDRWPMRVFF